MSALALLTPERSSANVASINVHTRIEHFFRNQKHPVVIIGQNQQDYSTVASELLANLSDNENAAFVSATQRLTNIQLRCRIIEQLFFDPIFDPEKELYSSVNKLQNKQPDPIVIVIEHAQYVTSQMLHEFCQVAELAKKNGRIINIALFGNLELGQKLTKEKVVFDKRVSIISALDGQPIALQQKNFIKEKSYFTKKVNYAIALSTLTFIVAISLFYGLTEIETKKSKPLATLATTPDVFVKPIPKAVDEISNAQVSKVIINSVVNTNKIENQATAEQIAAVLQGHQIDVVAPVTVKPQASPSDILTALQENAQETTKVSPIPSLKAKPAPVKKSNKEVSPFINFKTDAGFFMSYDKGYAVQLVGFANKDLMTKYLNQHNSLFYLTYLRELNGKPYLIITSGIYETKALAKQYLNSLDESLKSEGAFIKSVAQIHNEITKYQKDKH